MNIHLHGFNLLEFLARTPLFSVLPGDELERVANSCRLRSFNKGDDVFRVGAPCEAGVIDLACFGAWTSSSIKSPVSNLR
mgnify:CR=1 FL=1